MWVFSIIIVCECVVNSNRVINSGYFGKDISLRISEYVRIGRRLAGGRTQEGKTTQYDR